MTKIEYYKVPLLGTRRLYKELCDKQNALVTRKGNKLFFQGNDFLVAVERNIATVIYGTTINEETIRNLFKS